MTSTSGVWKPAFFKGDKRVFVLFASQESETALLDSAGKARMKFNNAPGAKEFSPLAANVTYRKTKGAAAVAEDGTAVPVMSAETKTALFKPRPAKRQKGTKKQPVPREEYKDDRAQRVVQRVSGSDALLAYAVGLGNETNTWASWGIAVQPASADHAWHTQSGFIDSSGAHVGELTALLHAIDAAVRTASQRTFSTSAVHVICNSDYACDVVDGVYTPTENKDLCARLVAKVKGAQVPVRVHFAPVDTQLLQYEKALSLAQDNMRLASTVTGSRKRKATSSS